jgi:hypothetical protein
MAFRIAPPPNDTDVQGVAWKQWFFKLIDVLAQPLDLSFVSGILSPANGGTGTSTIPTANQLLVGNVTGTFDLKTLVAGSNITITNGVSTITIEALSGGSGKIYEPVVSTASEFMFSSNGDILMAWGGDYAS